MTAEARAFRTLGRAMTEKMYFRRVNLLVAAAELYRSLGNARDAGLAIKLEGLTGISSYADFQAAIA